MANLTPAERAFYTTQSSTSAAGDFAKLLDPLPADPPGVVRVVSGLVIHPLRSHAALSRIRTSRRATSGAIGSVTSSVVSLARPRAAPGRSPVDNGLSDLSSVALLATSIFRHHGIPARVRVGFRPLLRTWGIPRGPLGLGIPLDGGWRLLDAALGDQAIAETYAIDFPPTDFPARSLPSPPASFGALRRREIDDATCGVIVHSRRRGAWFVGASILGPRRLNGRRAVAV